MSFFASIRPFLVCLFTWCMGTMIHAQDVLLAPQIVTIPSSGRGVKVRKILKGKEGFLWIATSGGLKRFDGRQFKTYINQGHTDAKTTKQNNIFDLLLDGNGKMWVATELGLYSFDFNSGRFEAMVLSGIDFSTKFVHRLKKLNGSVVAFTIFSEGICFFNEKSKDLKFIKLEPEKNEAGFNNIRKKNLIYVIHKDIYLDSICWLGTQEGLLRLNLSDYSCQEFINLSYTNGSYIAKSNIIVAIHQSSDTSLVLGTWGGGMSVFNMQNGSFRNFLFKNSNNRLSSSVRALMPLENGLVYCLTGYDNFVFDPRTEQKVKDVVLPPELEATVMPFFKDKKHRYWGQFGSFLGLIDPLANQFEKYPFIADYKRKDFRCSATVEYEGNDKILVTADDVNGAYILNRKTGQWTAIGLPVEKVRNNLTLRSYGAIKTKDGEWIIMDYLGLYTFSPGDKRMRPYRIQLPFKDASYRSIIQGSEGDVWVGSHNRGLMRFSPETGKVRVYYDELFENGQAKNTTGIWYLFEDNRKNIWIRCSRGFSVYEREKDIFHNFPYEVNPENTFDHVSGFFQDDDGRIWVGGNEGLGIVIQDSLEKGITRKIAFPVFKGQTPYNFIKYDHEKVWLQCNNDFYIFDPHKEKIIRRIDPAYGYGEREKFGLSQLSSGEMCIGYHGGIKIFHPDSLVFNREVPHPYIYSIKINNKLIKKDSNLLNIKQLKVPYFQNTLSFGISAIAFSFAEQVRFRVKMEGADKDWVELAKNQDIVSYFQLPPGQYDFLVKAANNEGVWSAPRSLQIIVSPPWWQTLWFYALAIMGVLAIVFVIFKSQLKRQLIEQQTLRLREINDLKNRLITNITHEFRTPLTVIEGMANELAEAPMVNPKKKAGLIKKNSRRLLNLVNQMLELAKLEHKDNAPNWVQDDIIPFLAYIADAYSSLASGKNISLQFYAETPAIIMDFDPERTRKILHNLISNALKFTPEYGKVLVVAKKEGSSLFIKVIDSGIGISPEHLPNIFSRFYRADESGNVEGSGIGLAIAKEMTALLGGKISVESRPGKGSTFMVELPVANTAPLQKSYPDALPKKQTDSPFSESSIPGLLFDQDKPLALIVEDNADLVYYLKNCLSASYNLLVARNGEEGIHSAFSSIPDIIISDVMMPRKDGYELCETLKSDLRTSHVPIILLTAKADEKSKLAGLERGADAYLKKPFSKEELLLRMSKLIELRKKLLARYADISPLKKGRATGFSQEDQFMANLHNALAEHLGDARFSTPQLCRKMAMSRTQLYRKVKALTGHSLATYIRKYRLSHARHLLHTTDLRISEIALSCGFESFSWFAQAFREEFGTAPSELRR